eukprot:g78001.t1
MSEAVAVSQLTCLSIPQSKPPLFPCWSVLTSTHSPFPCATRKSAVLQCPPTLSTIPPFSLFPVNPFSRAPDRPDCT